MPPAARVLHVLDHSLPLQSGYVFRTLGVLRAQRALGWETFHLTSPKQASFGAAAEAEETVDGWLFHRTEPLRPGADGGPPVWRELALMRAAARRLDGLVARLRPTLIHAHSPLLNGYPALWVGRRHRLPVVYEVRAFWEDAAVDQGTVRQGDLRYRATRALENRLMRRADAVVTICEGLRGDILARGGVPARKVAVAPNAVDAARFSTERRIDEGLRRRLGLEDASAVLGFIGSFYPYEGLELLVGAMPDLLREHPGARLLLVGGGPAADRIAALAASLGLGGRVVLPGRVPHGEVGRYYDLVDAFVYPRLPMRLTELVTPLKPLEAMAAGRLVVASDVGGHRELVRDGETGFLFGAGDRRALLAILVQVLAARDRWPAVVREARSYVERERSWERVGRVYADVASGLRRPPGERSSGNDRAG